MDASHWDDRYAAADLVWSAEPNQFLPPAVEGMEPGRALDLACGEGRNAIWLARQGWDVTGVDFSEVAIDKARRLAGDTVVDWRVEDVTDWQPDGAYDLVVVFYVHLAPDGLDRAVAAARAALAPGGRLFAVGHAVRNLDEGVGGPQHRDVLWGVGSMRPRLDGLDVIELGERIRPVEGSERPAIDLVVDAVRR